MSKLGNIGNIKNRPRRAALAEAAFALHPQIAKAADIPQGTADTQAQNGDDTGRMTRVQVNYTA